MTYPVKNFSYDMRGAPIINGTPGSFINALKACLIDGFGEATAITGNVIDGVCTLFFNQGEFFKSDSVISVSGVNIQSINGEQWVISNTQNSCSFKTLESDQTLIGTIKVKYAPVGYWYMPFTGTNTAVFRSAHPSASNVYYQIDDTSANHASLRTCQSMTNTTSGENFVPPQTEEPFYFHKSTQANTIQRAWNLFSDGKTVYYNIYAGFNGSNLETVASNTFAFGDYIPEDFETTIKSFTIGDRITNATTNRRGEVFYINSNSLHTEVKIYLDPVFKTYNNNFRRTVEINSGDERSGNSNVFGEVNLINKKKLISRISVICNKNFLGYLPGILYNLNNHLNMNTYNNIIIDGVGNLYNRKLKYVRSSTAMSQYGTSYEVLGLIDITGPWE